MGYERSAACGQRACSAACLLLLHAALLSVRGSVLRVVQMELHGPEEALRPSGSVGSSRPARREGPGLAQRRRPLSSTRGWCGTPRARPSCGLTVPLRMPGPACPSQPAALSYWSLCPVPHGGSAPIYNGVYQHLLKGAAVRLNHTTASRLPRLSRLVARAASSYWLQRKSVRPRPASTR